MVSFKSYATTSQRSKCSTPASLQLTFRTADRAQPGGAAAASIVGCTAMTSGAPKPIEEQLLEQALQLPKAKRLRLAEQLCESVQAGASDAWPADVHPAWKEEITNRVRSLMDGSAVLIDSTDHLRRLRDKYGA